MKIRHVSTVPAVTRFWVRYPVGNSLSSQDGFISAANKRCRYWWCLKLLGSSRMVALYVLSPVGEFGRYLARLALSFETVC